MRTETDTQGGEAVVLYDEAIRRRPDYAVDAMDRNFGEFLAGD